MSAPTRNNQTARAVPGFHCQPVTNVAILSETNLSFGAKCDSPGDCSSCSKSGVECSRDTKRLLHGQPKPGYVESLLQLFNVKQRVSARRDSTKRETNVDAHREQDTKMPNLSPKSTSESNNRILTWIRSGALLLRARVKVTQRQNSQPRRRREVTIGKILQHPNVLPVHGIVEDRMFGPFGAIVTPWCLNGNAAQYLHKHAPSPLERYRLWQGVVGGLVYLHSHSPQIVHGDMKPPNVLIAADGRPKICDLDWFCSDESRMDARSIPRLRIRAHRDTFAPELVDLNDPSEPTTATDAYAAGCIGFE
ncbi:SubName: Full=Uncharacterized protein {ECO:0000313/EMBL:CCA75949.1}, partial [Serendipita indica DSM 11827]